MASIGNDSGNRKRILFYAPCGARKTIRLGKCSKRDAESIKYRVEGLLASQITGAMDRDLSLWVAGLHPDLRTKLERVGLLEPLEPEPAKPTVSLDAFLTDFLERNGPGKKPATRVVWLQVMTMLREIMPKGIALEDVTAGHAKMFLAKLKERGLASATIHKRVGFARQFFQDAMDWELIEKNPFARVKTQTSSSKSNVEVPRETIKLVLAHCDTAWATVVGLCRFGGLRCPSEVLSLKWGDVDWENERMAVPEPKVEHHEGRGVRAVPLFPELRPILEAAWNEATDGTSYPSPDSYVVNKPAYRAAAMTEAGWGNSNLRTQFLKVLKLARVTPWARLFHSMRASRQTELEREFPLHVVCAWLGNTEAIAKKHYLLVSDDDFAKATALATISTPNEAARNAAQSDSEAARNAAPQAAASSTHGNEETPGNAGETCVSSVLSGVPKAEGTGLEPAAPYGVPQFQ